MRFQPIEYYVPADSKFLVAGLADQILDIFVLAMHTIPHQGVDGFIGNQVVGTTWIGTKIALSPYRLLLSTFPFDDIPGCGHIGASFQNRFPAGEGIPALRTILLALGLQLAGFWGR